MDFVVTEIAARKNGDDLSAHITLECRDGRTIYVSTMYLKVPIEEYVLYRLGQVLEVELPLFASAPHQEMLGKKPSEPDYAVRP